MQHIRHNFVTFQFFGHLLLLHDEGALTEKEKERSTAFIKAPNLIWQPLKAIYATFYSVSFSFQKRENIEELKG